MLPRVHTKQWINRKSRMSNLLQRCARKLWRLKRRLSIILKRQLGRGKTLLMYLLTSLKRKPRSKQTLLIWCVLSSKNKTKVKRLRRFRGSMISVLKSKANKNNSKPKRLRIYKKRWILFWNISRLIHLHLRQMMDQLDTVCLQR